MPVLTQDPEICVAARNGQLREVQSLIASGAEINTRGRGEWTPLHEAAWKGHLELVSWLLQNGANVKAKSVVVRGEDAGKTPLHVAVEKNHEPVAKLLLDNGANINAKKSNGYTPLMIAAEQGSESLVQMLVNRGAKVSLIGQCGASALSSAVIRNRPSIAQLLIEKGADVNQREPGFDSTLLMSAASDGHAKVVELLLHLGADPHAQDRNGMTALHHAALGANVTVTKHVLELGKDWQEHTDLEKNPEAVTRILLEAGIDQGVRDKDGMTPLDVATKMRAKSVIQILTGSIEQ